MASRVVKPVGPMTKLQSQRSRARAAEMVFVHAKEMVRSRDQDRCVWCGLRGQEVHHRMNRGAGGSPMDPSSSALSRLVLLCSECHRLVGQFPQAAEDQGLLVRHGVTACAEVPLLYRGNLSMLTDDGQIVQVES